MKITVDIDEKDIEKMVVESIAMEIVNKLRNENWLMFDIEVDKLLAMILKKEHNLAYNTIKEEVDSLLSDDNFIREHVKDYIKRVLRGEL